MKIQGTDFRRKTVVDGLAVKHEITFTTTQVKECDHFFSMQLPSELQVEIRTAPKKRSMDANAYFWTLADKLAKKLFTTKDEIYRELIQRVGVFKYALVRKEDKSEIVKEWEHNGTGWIAQEEYYPSKDYVQLRLYKGSSVYSTSEMARLIDELILECKEQGVDTLTPKEKDELLQRWDVK